MRDLEGSAKAVEIAKAVRPISSIASAHNLSSTPTNCKGAAPGELRLGVELELHGECGPLGVAPLVAYGAPVVLYRGDLMLRSHLVS